MKYFSLKRLGIRNDVFNTLAYGVLSLFLQYIEIAIPGYEGVQSDLRELSLLIGTLKISNPLFIIGLSLFSAIRVPMSADFFYFFFLHLVPLLLNWYFFKVLNKQKLKRVYYGFAAIVIVLVYYLVIVSLAIIIPSNIPAFDTEQEFITQFITIISSIKLEIFSTSIVVSLFFVQSTLWKELNNHKQNLEKKVQQRTKDLKDSLEELKIAQNHLIQSQKVASLGTLASGVAHEINNPLNFISGGTYMLEDIKQEIELNISKESSKKYLDAVNIISEGINRSVSIVAALKTFSKKGVPKLEFKEMHLIIDNTLLLLKNDIPDYIEVDKEYGLTKEVPVYPDKIHQVFVNILNNAVFSLSSSNRTEKKITIKTFKEKNAAVVEVANNGAKIPKENLNQIFDPFFTTKDPDQGKGLGLSISYNYIKEQNGKLSAKNTTDGVCFIIELPLEL